MDREFFNDIVVVKRSGQRVNFNSTKVAIELQQNRNKCKCLVHCLVQIQKMCIHHIAVAELEMLEHR